jgi:hypothetical protein
MEINCILQRKDGRCGYCVWMDICNGINKSSRHKVNNVSQPGKKLRQNQKEQLPEDSLKVLRDMFG